MTGSFESLDSAGRKALADRILASVLEKLKPGNSDTFSEIVQQVTEELAIAPDQVTYAIVAGQSRGTVEVSVGSRGVPVLALA